MLLPSRVASRTIDLRGPDLARGPEVARLWCRPYVHTTIALLRHCSDATLGNNRCQTVIIFPLVGRMHLHVAFKLAYTYCGSCAVLCHIVYLHYLSRQSFHRLAGLPCCLVLSYNHYDLQMVTREVHPEITSTVVIYLTGPVSKLIPGVKPQSHRIVRCLDRTIGCDWAK